MAHRNRNDFDSTGDSSGGDDNFGRPGGSLDDGVDDLTADSDASGSAAAAAAELERKLAEAQDKYLRQAAEYDNYRKRTIKERTEAAPRAQADIVRQLLDPLDDLARFAHVDPATVDPATIVQGAEMVEKKLLKALGAAGLETIDPVNQSFDPQLHEAVATEPALAPEDDHVVARVYQVGYKFNGQLLRPARVVVKQWNG
ncbi:MAG TPA: nucleotide exchange factor GrpE [Gemmatimonadaceae bacterium]|jgi:molecular chaperone GrpE